ncbi:MAG: hypothetical protein ACJAZN_002531, partial [Planctomycetota bacterium]
MILSLLERLEQEGGGSGWRPGGLAADLQSGRRLSGARSLLPSRWFASVESLGNSEGATTSGRLTSASTLVSERTDDGVLVAAPVAGSSERIVWVGDLELGDPSGSSGEFKTPAFEFHDDGMGLDVSWPIAGRRGAQGAGATYTMRLTLPCRPVGELTFSNDELDTEVWLCATRDGRMAARMRPYSAHPELEIVPGSGTLEFERSPDWRLGLEVMDPDGTVRVEDRFSPGTFVLRIPEGENRVQLSIRIVAPNAAERGRRGGALGALLGHVGSPAGQPVGAPKSGQAAKLTPDELRLTAMSLPGDLMRRGVRSFDAESELRDLLLEAAPHVNGPRFDVALWAARAAFLIHPGATRDVTSVTLPFLRGVVGRIERDLVSTGCPGAAAAGLPRWCHLPSILGGAELGGGSELGGGAELGGGSGPGTAPEMDTEISAGTSGEIAVEHAALL